MVICQSLQGQLESEAGPEPKSPVLREVEKKADRNIAAGSEGIDGQQQGAGSIGSVPVWCGALKRAVQLVRGNCAQHTEMLLLANSGEKNILIKDKWACLDQVAPSWGSYSSLLSGCLSSWVTKGPLASPQSLWLPPSKSAAFPRPSFWIWHLRSTGRVEGDSTGKV